MAIFFGQSFAFIHTAQIQAGHLNEANTNKHGGEWTQHRKSLNKTLTGQDRTRCSYIKEGMGMKSLTQTRKLYFANYATNRSQQPTRITNLFYHLHNNHFQQDGESLWRRDNKVQPKYSMGLSFAHCTPYVEESGESSCWNLQQQKHGPNLRGQEKV